MPLRLGSGGSAPRRHPDPAGGEAQAEQPAAKGEAPAPGGGTRGPEGISTGADRGCVSELIVARVSGSCEGAKVKISRELFTECPLLS